jgi:Na+-driven multidrug efflux pump
MLTFVFGWGSIGAWLSLYLFLTLFAFLVMLRYYRTDWLNVKQKEAD